MIVVYQIVQYVAANGGMVARVAPVMSERRFYCCYVTLQFKQSSTLR